MSVTYFIGPFDPALWKDGAPELRPTSLLKIDPSDYRDKLLQRWPSAREWEAHEFAAGILWALDEYNLVGVEVALHKDLQHVGISPYGTNLLDFIIWHRAYVPGRFRLYLFNTSSWESLILDADTDRATVKEYCGLVDEEIIRESPLNGTWDGTLKPQAADAGGPFRCTLHLFEYRDRLSGEFLTHDTRRGGGAIYIQLRGVVSAYDKPFQLDRERTINRVGGGLDSDVEYYDILRLRYTDGNPPSLTGSCSRRKGKQKEVLGEVELTLRGLYDPPPPLT